MENEIISKELLSEVLSCEIIEVYINEDSNTNNISFDWISIQSKHRAEINIHELAHRCKEWAINNEYTILSGYKTGRGYVYIREIDSPAGWQQKTEPEAIFKACQWIYDNKDKG